MLYKLRKRILVFHSAQEGQAIVFVALFCLVMALFAFMVINIGYLTSNRIEAQNSADAVALSSDEAQCVTSNPFTSDENPSPHAAARQFVT